MKHNVSSQLSSNDGYLPKFLVELSQNNLFVAGLVTVCLIPLLFMSYVSIISLKSALEERRNWRLLQHEGIRTEAIILEVTDRGRDNRARYAYEVPIMDGQKLNIEKWEDVVASTWRSLEAGEKVLIIYDPINPTNSRIEGNQRYDLGSLTVVIYNVCCFVPITGLMIVLSLAAIVKKTMFPLCK
jgi:hypothetical protein